MNSDAAFLLVHCTCPDLDCARSIASLVVEKRLAACANLVAGVSSTYLWQGRMEQSEEVLLLLKTRQSLYSALETAIKSAHPYDVPEIIACPIVAGSADYLNWVEENTCEK